MKSTHPPLRAVKDLHRLNAINFSVARSQRPRSTRTRRYWPPWLAAIAIACSSPTPHDRAIGGDQGVTVDAGADVDTSADVDASTDAPTSWCSVQAILALKCQRCHASPAAHGAPFALVSYDDTQVLDRKGRARFERIGSVVEEQSMPPVNSIKLEPPVEPLQEQERATILSWYAQGGTLAGSASCEPAP